MLGGRRARGERRALAPHRSRGELYICSDPCPEDTSHCEVLDLDPASHRLVESTQTFAPGTVLHLGAPAAPFEDHFAVMLRVAPE